MLSTTKYLFCLIFLFLVCYSKKVAIIGAGIGGTSAAYYLLKNSGIEVDIFESRDRVGGRVYSEKILNKTTNFGASFLLKENQMIFQMTKELNVSTMPIGGDDDSLGIFNNKTILLTLGSSDFFNFFKVAWRYGILSPLRTLKIIKQHLKKFDEVYDLLKSKNTSNTLNELLKKTHNEYLVNTTIGKYLISNGVNKKFVNELLSAMLAGIYNQHMEINSYAGFVALIGAGMSPVKIVGGNDFLIKKIVEANTLTGKFNLFLNLSVSEIVKKDGGYYLTDQNGNTKFYDIVIIACPLKQTNIKFTNINILEKNYYPGNFLSPYIAWARGKPRPEFFNWRNNDKLPNTLTSINKHNGIVIQMSHYVNDSYRIGSEYELTEKILENLGYFEKGVEIFHRYHWSFAYPAFEKFSKDLSELPEFVLDENGLYYINAIEAAASCMELSMISARNIINIIEAKLLKK